MLEQKWQNSLFATQKQENDWVYTPNQGALRCAPPAPLSRLAGCALAVQQAATAKQQARQQAADTAAKAL